MYLFVVLFLSALAAAASSVFTPSTATIYAWPLSAKSPSPMAKISITSETQATVDSYTQPSFAKEDEIVRIGLYDSSSKQWTGVATSTSTLDAAALKQLTLHLDEEGKVWNVGIGSGAATEEQPKTKGKKDAKKDTRGDEKIIVTLKPMRDGPSPILNKPIVLNAEGKIPQPDLKDERNFFTKYWWAIGLFVVLQLVAGGGGGDSK